MRRLTYLDESDVLRVLTKALTAHIQVILADEGTNLSAYTTNTEIDYFTPQYQYFHIVTIDESLFHKREGENSKR